MMTTPYHLRQNKAVDRYLFAETLRRISPFQGIDSYSYFGLGGYSFEDFKVLHLQFGIVRMISFETKRDIHCRQRFNRPFGCIDARHMSCGDFIKRAEDFLEGCSIVWLDYEKANERRKQIAQFEQLLGKLYAKDIVRITLNADPQTLARETYEIDGVEVTNQKRLESFEEQIKLDFRRSTLTKEVMTLEGLPQELLFALQAASEVAFKGSDLVLSPLTSFVYTDQSHQMLTFTGIVLEKGDMEVNFWDATGLKQWELLTHDWADFNPIAVPILTAKEKMLIDSLLPSGNADELAEKLESNYGLPLDKDELENYMRFYRQYAGFHQVLF